VRTITNNDEVAPWSRSNHLMGTRLLPSGDDSDNFSLLQNPWTEIMIIQAPITGTV
jgi:hypothetical protein